MINSVRNTVLSILNKNNYGYISPSDFNLYAKQAQMEFFDEYFASYNKVVNMENSRLSGVDYANIRKPIEEAMESFSETKPLSKISNNIYSIPTLFTTGDEAYLINRVTCYSTKATTGTNTSVVSFSLVNSAASFITAGVESGDIVSNDTAGTSTTVVTVVNATTLLLSSNIFTTTAQTYSVYTSSKSKDAERVSQSKIRMLITSLLTAPNEIFPAYIQEKTNMTVYPKTISGVGQVWAQYFRYPKDPKWTYISLVGGEPSFDQSQPDYQDFELPNEDEYKLIVKILQYCGVSIRETEVAQFGVAQEQHEQPSFSQKQ